MHDGVDVISAQPNHQRDRARAMNFESEELLVKAARKLEIARRQRQSHEFFMAHPETAEAVFRALCLEMEEPERPEDDGDENEWIE